MTKHGVVALSESLFIDLAAVGSPVKVSALCPGFVKTDLAGEGAVDPERSDDRRAGRRVHARPVSRPGIPASEIADAVLDAIVAERFWILTHPEMNHVPVERMERAEAQINPPMFGAA